MHHQLEVSDFERGSNTTPRRTQRLIDMLSVERAAGRIVVGELTRMDVKSWKEPQVHVLNEN